MTALDRQAWFFTRVGDKTVNAMKSQKSIEFIWRASSSLPAAESELLAHVWESYYCYPLPTYAFEWGPGGARAAQSAACVRCMSMGRKEGTCRAKLCY